MSLNTRAIVAAASALLLVACSTASPSATPPPNNPTSAVAVTAAPALATVAPASPTSVPPTATTVAAATAAVATVGAIATSAAPGPAATVAAAATSVAPAAAATTSAAVQRPPTLPPGVATSLDPCQLVTSSEASSLAGTTYPSGTEQDNQGGSKTCVYGSQTANVFMVTVAQATDAATAQADWSQEQAQAQNAMTRSVPPGVTVNFNTNDLSNVQGADRAALAQASMNLAGRPINAVAIYLLKGANFVTFSNLQVGQPGPTPEAMQSEAQTVVGRIP